MKEMRRVLALVLCFVMLVGVLPVGALAAEAETTAPSETVTELQVTEAASAAAETGESSVETTAASTETTAAAPAAETTEATEATEATVADEAIGDMIEEGAVLLSLAIEGIAQTVEALDITGDALVAAAMENIDGLIDYVAYDIEAEMGEGETATVSIPIPEGWDTDNLIVYYVDDNGVVSDETFEGTYDAETGLYTFETTHFSIYVVGYGENETEVEVEDPETSPGNDDIISSTSKTVYVLTSSISSGNEYLIVNSNSAGNCYALANDSGSVADTNVTVVTGDVDGDGDNETYIELEDAADELWTVSNSYRFQNGEYYLGYTTSGSGGNTSYNFGLSTTARNWSYNSYNNRLSIRPNYTTYYLRYSSGWGWSNNDNNRVYFYVPTEVEVETTVPVEGTYSIAGEDLTKVVAEDTKATLSSTLTFAYEGGEKITDTSTTATYTPVEGGDPNGVISNIDGNTVTFSGKYGKALVKVSYDTNDDGVDDVTNYITVNAQEPYYTVEITKDDEVVEGIIAVKSVTSASSLQLGQVVSFENGGDEAETVTPAEGTITWEIPENQKSIATVDNDGLVTFKGVDGTIQVTVKYEYADGSYVTDTVTVSVSKSSYTIPSDGTDDFPEYPNEGAIRIDKNATAVGNFSETGVAQVELSMTGVPYTKGNEIDVVIMMDMSNSMGEARVADSQTAANAALEAIVKNEDGTYNDNRVAVYSFNGWLESGYSSQIENIDATYNIQKVLDLDSLSSDAELEAAKAEISANDTMGAGTNYAVALKQCYTTLYNNRQEGRAQFVIFMTDGVPTTGFAYVNSDDGKSLYYNSDLGNYGQYIGDDDLNLSEKDEYYSRQMKNEGVSIYTVALHISDDEGQQVLKNIAGTSAGDGSDTGFEDYAQKIDEGEDSSKLTEVFENIVNAIKEAATDVTVTDKITDEYTLILNSPANVTLPEGTELCVEVVQYQLDANKNRVEPATVIETVSITDTTKVTTDDSGNIVSIDADNFTYDAETQILTWKAEKLDTTELAIRYYVYLNNSGGVAAADQVAAGTYPTNDYAYIDYTNFNGNECRKEFPVPQMTWNGAQVSYTFYLVNSQGEPVNRAGKVVPFAEAVYVTDVFTYAVLWNEASNEGTGKLEASYLADELVPDVYKLYDENATYNINVYEDETAANRNNYFVIGGDTGTTYVFNTKAGDKYSAAGAYSATGTYLDANGVEQEATQITGFDFSNTTVAFAVVWTAGLEPDTVVIDYALPVVIDVTTNDAVNAEVIGVLKDAPAGVEIGSGNIATPTKAASAEVDHGTVTRESLTSVRYTLNDTTIQEPVVFYYEAAVEYYSGNTLKEQNMYSSVTVIPATTVYYEDTFLTLNSYTKGADGAFALDAASKWVTDGTAESKNQAQDRPGASDISGALDADNNYGYDGAYDSMATHSMGSSAKITVDANTRGEATFSFYGTGFDVISTTSSDTGTLIVQVYAGDKAEGPALKTWTVDTYYGYEYLPHKVTYTYGNNGWFEFSAEPVDTLGTSDSQPENPALNTSYVIYENRMVATGAAGGLYQIPVMKIFGLEYGQYTAKIIAGYGEYFDHDKADASYDLYLDAVRIYDPTGNLNGTANDAYVADGEAYPKYQEVRNNVISAEGVTTSKDENGKVTVTFPTDDNIASGAIFVDGVGSTRSISDYVGYGPNNELYLTKGQTVAFSLKLTEAPYVKNGTSIAADIQIGMKSATSSAVKVELTIMQDDEVVDSTVGSVIPSTTTDMYYSIGSKLDLTKDVTIIIENVGDAASILSLTNVKATFTENPDATTYGLMRTSASDAAAVLMFLNEEAEQAEPEVALDADLQVSIRNKNIKVGSSIVVKATTSADVDYLTVNGQKVTKYTESKSTGKRTWSVNVKAAEAGDMDIEVIAYSEDGVALETVTETVEVTGKKTGVVQQIIGQLIGMLGR